MLVTIDGSRSDGGGSVLTPKRCTPVASSSLRSRPTCPNVVLHDSMKPSSSVPPHTSPPKFCSVAVVSGSCSSDLNGKCLLTSTLSCSAVEAVTVLNVEPGG